MGCAALNTSPAEPELVTLDIPLAPMPDTWYADPGTASDIGYRLVGIYGVWVLSTDLFGFLL